MGLPSGVPPLARRPAGPVGARSPPSPCSRAAAGAGRRRAGRWLALAARCARTGETSALADEGGVAEAGVGRRARCSSYGDHEGERREWEPERYERKLHRKTALFYKTLNGARVGDLFMSIIHTAELAKIDVFGYLVALQRHHQHVAEGAAAWMPWNYAHALALITERTPAK